MSNSRKPHHGKPVTILLPTILTVLWFSRWFRRFREFRELDMPLYLWWNTLEKQIWTGLYNLKNITLKLNKFYFANRCFFWHSYYRKYIFQNGQVGAGITSGLPVVGKKKKREKNYAYCLTLEIAELFTCVTLRSWLSSWWCLLEAMPENESIDLNWQPLWNKIRITTTASLITISGFGVSLCVGDKFITWNATYHAQTCAQPPHCKNNFQSGSNGSNG